MALGAAGAPFRDLEAAVFAGFALLLAADRAAGFAVFLAGALIGDFAAARPLARPLFALVFFVIFAIPLLRQRGGHSRADPFFNSYSAARAEEKPMSSQ